MGDQNQGKPLREVVIADHLVSCLEKMAREMGTDRDGLVNQALSMFARFNGFVVPAKAEAAIVAPRAAKPVASGDDAARQAVAKHVMDTAAEFEKLLKGKKR